MARMARLERQSCLEGYAPSANGQSSKGLQREHMSLPNHRSAGPEKFTLKPVGGSPRSRRTVAFENGAQVTDDLSPPSLQDCMSPDELVEKDLRLRTYDRMWMLLQRIFLREGRFVEGLSPRMPAHRRIVAIDAAIDVWEYLARKEDMVTPGRDEHQLCLCLIHSAFLILIDCVFRDLSKFRSPILEHDEVNSASRGIANYMATFFFVFQRSPFGECYATFVLELLELSTCAFELRALLSPRKNYTFSVYMPLMGRASERRVDLLKSHVRVHETIGFNRPTVRGEQDLIQMALCGGIIRKEKTVQGPTGLLPRYRRVCERQAVCVAYRPMPGETLSNKLTGDGSTEEDRVVEARMQALKLERKVANSAKPPKEPGERDSP